MPVYTYIPDNGTLFQVEGDPDTGITQDASSPNTLSFQAGGVEALRIEEVAGETTTHIRRSNTAQDMRDLIVENELAEDVVFTIRNLNATYNFGIDNSAGDTLIVSTNSVGSFNQLASKVFALNSDGIGAGGVFSPSHAIHSASSTSLGLGVADSTNTPDAAGLYAQSNANEDVDLIVGRKYSGDASRVEWARYDKDGRQTITADTTAIADAKMKNSSISFYVDGSGHLICKKKDSGGTVTTAQLNNAAFS